MEREEKQNLRGKAEELTQRVVGGGVREGGWGGGPSWHIIEGHFNAKPLIDKSTNLPGRR